MDEIVIGEKKYISSKQAAKATGYAKDYIGQLCREGRVPARLVGRSWYVLEAAIQDHRFGGEQKSAPAASAVSKKEEKWEPSRYEASETEALPSVNRLKEDQQELAVDDVNKDVELGERLQETWKAWFDRFDTAVGADAVSAGGPGNEIEGAESAPSEEEDSVQEQQEQEEVEAVQSEDVAVPIRAIYHAQYQPPPEDLLPRRMPEPLVRVEAEPAYEEREEPREGRRMGRRLVLSVQALGVLLAVISVAVAVLGSGYFDTYIISNRQASMIAGVVLYDK